LAHLHWAHLVDLEGEHPAVRLRESFTKTARAALQPISREVARVLLELRGPQSRTGKVFDSIPRSRTFQAHLIKAGIPIITEEGDKLDFHALRVTYCTWLAANGVELRVAQGLMRHATLDTTNRVYTSQTHLRSKRRQAIDTMPEVLSAEASEENQKPSVISNSQKLAANLTHDFGSVWHALSIADDMPVVLLHL